MGNNIDKVKKTGVQKTAGQKTAKKKNTDGKKRKKAAKRRFLFLKILMITLSGFSILVIAGWAIAFSMAKPPDVSSVPTPFEPIEAAFLSPEGDEEDLLINKGLHAPEGFTADDRKELFYTFLIIGLDGGVNTDTIMVASYDGVKHEANIIGIPRDSLVNVKRNAKKINSAYPVGTLNGGGKAGGVDQLKREVKTIIGFVPDFYVAVDLNAFVQIVDAVDGIEVNVPYDMKYDDPEQNLHIDIKMGEQILNGANALKFSRYRKGSSGYKSISDYQRIENQHAVIKAMVSRLLRPGSLLKIPEFVEIFTENVYTDIKPENMLWFADQLTKISGSEALSTHTMPTTGTSGPPYYYEYLDKDAIIELINNTINPYTKDIEEKDVDIISGS